MAIVRDRKGVFESTRNRSRLNEANVSKSDDEEDREEENVNEEAEKEEEKEEEEEEKEEEEEEKEEEEEEEKESDGEEEEEEKEEEEEEKESDGEKDEEEKEEEEEEKESDGEEDEEEKEQEEEEKEQEEEEKEQEEEEKEQDGEEDEEKTKSVDSGRVDEGEDSNYNVSTALEDDDEDTQPVQPEKLFFGKSEYNKTCKMSTRCSVTQVVKEIEDDFPKASEWFKRHEQFKHVFHMYREPNHMLQAMWMLLLRTAHTENENECWFIVNGVPVRYSIREHALLTGLNCHKYPSNWKKLGDTKFVEKIFKKKKGIKISDVKKKLEELKNEGKVERKKVIVLKLTILYFLSKVVRPKSKSDATIDEFLLRIVNDVHLCEIFPWGRLTFDDNLLEITRFLKNFKGVVKPNHQAAFNAFIIPLEVLAFECIPHLGLKFREVVPAEKDCPRLCKHKFSDSANKGFPLEDINDELGSTKEIMSILEADTDEKEMLAEILPDSVDDGTGVRDCLTESWVQRLIVDRKKIWWKDLYELDLAGRSEGVPKRVSGVGDKSDGVPQRDSRFADNVTLESLAGMVRELKEVMEQRFEDVKQHLGVMDNRLTKLEEFIDAVELVPERRTGDKTSGDVAEDVGEDVAELRVEDVAEDGAEDVAEQDAVGETVIEAGATKKGKKRKRRN